MRFWPGISTPATGRLTSSPSGPPYIAFVEVKARVENSLVSPFEAITPRKQRKIIATAQEYLRQHPSGLQPRFDAAAVHLQEGTVVGQEYLENAFWG